MSTAARDLAAFFNRECDCTLTDLDGLRQRLDTELARDSGDRRIAESHPHLFSSAPVFVDSDNAARMQEIVAALETAIQLPAYRRRVLGAAPGIAQIDARTLGVFMGFDFHIGPDGPRLIEINTNAGGAILNIAARATQTACCTGNDRDIRQQPAAPELESDIVGMFEREWRLARGDRPLRSIAIVDENPRTQYLYPEFLLTTKLFESRGIRACIADPAEFEVAEDVVHVRGAPVDLIYNRLTDFYFEDPRNRFLRAAFERDLAVVTPHPRVHALYADKRNLAVLGDADQLASLGLPQSGIDTLVRGIPRAREVNGCDETWWRERNAWFFKPRAGFGSRGAYRGDKMTRRVFAEIMKGGYLAQELTPPGERWRSSDSGRQAFKVDLRCYAYAGRIQQMVARLYQGQTTNFRTAGGGFAPVYVVG
jgi:hypothetical protein